MAEISPFSYFKAVLLVSFIYGFGITLLAYALPTDAQAFGETYEAGISNAGLGYETIAQDVEGSFNQQLNIPVIELGSLVYYSGNVLADLVVNFVTALPQIITLLLNGVVTVFGNNIEIGLLAILQGFISAVVLAFYVLAIVSLLLTVRSSGGVV